MRKDDLFKELDDMDIDSIAQEFPVLTADEKERIYAMSERKYNIGNNTDKDYSDTDETVVSGVEQYKRPSWYKYTSAAAALVLAIGGISGSMLLLKHGKGLHPNNNDLSTATTGEKTTSENSSAEKTDVSTGPATTGSVTTLASATEATEITTAETTTEAQTVPEEYEAIAHDLSDRFADLANKLDRNVQYDPNDTLEFYISGSDNYVPDLPMSYYSRVTEPGFESRVNYLDAFKEICTEELFERLYKNGGAESKPDNSDHVIDIDLANIFKADLSRYYTRDHVELYLDYGIKSADFIIYRGGLYVCTDSLPGNWRTYSDQPSVLDMSENSFKAVRNALFSPVCKDPTSQTGEPLTFSFVKEGESWKISDITEGGN